MKKLCLTILLAVSLVLLIGCGKLAANRTEIDKIFNVRLLGIDKLENGKIRLTLTSKSTKATPQSAGPTPQTTDVMVSEGETVFEAGRKLSSFANKRPHYGHIEFVLFGEDTARNGVIPYLDLPSRNEQFRYNAKIYIIKGEPAYSFINKLKASDTYIADKLISLEDNTFSLSETSKVTLAEALYFFDQKYTSTFLPYIQALKSDSSHTSDGGDYEVELPGYSVFKGDKLQDFISGKSSRGINWIKNRIRSGLIIVNAQDGKPVALEIIDTKTTIQPYMDENMLSCTIKVQFSSNIAETNSTSDIFTEEGMKLLEQQQTNSIKKEIEDILKYAQEKNMDMFGISSSFIRKYPMTKHELRKNWETLFPEIQFVVQVDSKISRTYMIKETNGAKK